MSAERRSALLHGGIAVLCCLALPAMLFLGRDWPLAGDSVLMHYVVFLSGHGFTPYRDIAEMNLPLTYMSEAAAMAVYGGGDAGWRIYDATLLLAIVAASGWLLRKHGAVAGLFCGTLFAAVHLQDGIHMAGQRDLLVAVLQAGAGLAVMASFPSPPRGERSPASPWRPMLLICLAAALGTAGGCIKPPALLFVCAAVLWRVLAGTRAADPGRGRLLLAACFGAALPVLLCAAYLHRFHATRAFLQALRGLVVYHASLERRPTGFLLVHAWSPVVPFVVLAFAAMAGWRRSASWSRLDTLAAVGAAAGLTSYVIQGKGFPYQRYPFLLWLLLLCSSQLFSMRRATDWPKRVAGEAALLSGMVLVAVFLFRSTRFRPVDPYGQLRSDLRLEGARDLNGKVQCLDTAGPCIGALYREGLTQSTGFLYDCYLLDAGNPTAQQQRQMLQREWTARPPALVVLTDSDCFTGRRTFERFRSWPWMEQELARYRVAVERRPVEPLRLWNRPEQPYAYRILRQVSADHLDTGPSSPFAHDMTRSVSKIAVQ